MSWVAIICFSAALGWTILSFMSYRDWNLVFQSSLVPWVISVVFWVAIRLNFARLRTGEKAKIPNRSRLAIAGVVMAASLSMLVFAVLSGQWLGKRDKSNKQGASVAQKSAPAPSSRGQRSQPAPTDEPKGEKPVETTAQKAEGLWSVQVAAFKSKQDAVKLATTLKDKGYEAYVMRAEVNAVNFYRTKVGRFRTRQEAERFLIALKDKEAYATAFVARM